MNPFLPNLVQSAFKTACTFIPVFICAFVTHGQEPIAVPDGYATLNGGTTGGGNATPILVSTASAFRSAVANDDPAVVIVQGRLDVGEVSVGSNKTIIGADASSGLYGGRVAIGGRNYIIQNLIIGPSNTDAMELSGATNVFIHKCDFYDGADGSLDIVRESDYVTVSWSKFYYVDQTTHKNTILIGNSDSRTSDRGKLHVTMHHNWFAEKCNSRMPRVRFGHVHIYNNYYNSVDNNYCVGIGVECHIRLENSHFDNINDPWEDYGGTSNGEIGWTGLKFDNCSQPTFMPNAFPVFTPPYSYVMNDVDDLKTLVRDPVYGAGNKKTGGLDPNAPFIAASGYIFEVNIDQGENAPDQTFQVWNAGADTLNYQVQEDSGLISVTPGSGSSKGSTDKVTHTITFETSGLEAGYHEAIITVADDGTGASNESVTITALIVVGPKIQTNTFYLETSVKEGGSPGPQTFMVWNDGKGTLNYEISEDTSWMSIDPASGFSSGVEDKQTHTVTYSMEDLPAGEYNGTVSVSIPGNSAFPKTVNVFVVVDPIPLIATDATVMNLSMLKGVPLDTTTFEVWNSGTGELVYSISDSPTWMAVSPSSGSSTGIDDKKTHSIYVNPRAMSVGEYDETITLSSKDAPNSPQTINVHLSVRDPDAGPWDPDGNGDMDTGEFLGWINVSDAPWIWSYSLAGWIFIADEAVTESGAWTWFPK